MSYLSLQSTLVLGLAGATLAAPAPAHLGRRQDEASVVETSVVEPSPTDAIGVLQAALSTFSTTSSSATATDTLNGADLASVIATAVANASTVSSDGATTTTQDTATTTSDTIEETGVVEEPSGTDTDLSRDEFCANVDLNTIDGALEVWDNRGVGKFHDEYLSKDNYANEGDWVNKMADYVFPGSGDAGGFGCGQRDQTCFNQGLDCQPMFDAGFGYEFWILNAVTKMQDVFERAHENLQDKVIDANINLDAIASDFKVTLSSPNALLKFISAAFGMAGGLVAFGRFGSQAGKLWQDDAKASATLFSGSFAASAAQTPDAGPNPGSDMSKALSDIFNEQLSLLDTYLKLAAGGEGDKNQLPDRGPVNGGDPASAIAGFFSHGRFVLQGEDVAEYFSQAYEFIDQKMVDIALAIYGYQILADHNQEDEGMCNEQSYAYWMDIDGGRCMRLVYKDGDNTYPPASDDVLKKLEGYGLEYKHYFDVACDCALNGADDGVVDLGSIPEDGQPARCFFNLPCQDAEVWLAGDNPDDDDDWVIGWPISFKEVMSWNN